MKLAVIAVLGLVVLANAQNGRQQEIDSRLSQSAFTPEKAALIRDRLTNQWNQWKTESNQLPTDFAEDTEKFLKIMDYAEKIFNGEMDEDEDEDEDMMVPEPGYDLEDADDDDDDEELSLEEEDEDDDEEEDDEEVESGPKKGKKKNAKKWKRKGKAGFRGRKDKKEWKKQGKGGFFQQMKSGVKQVKKYMKKLMKKSGPNVNQMWDLSIVPPQCANMTDKVERLCEKIQLSRRIPMMMQMMSTFGMDIKEGRFYEINQCCQADDMESRVECFKERRAERHASLCSSNGKRSKNECCQEAEEDIEACFAKRKTELCAKFWARNETVPGRRPGDFIPPNQMVDRAHPGRHGHHGGRDLYHRCCEVGRNFTTPNASVPVCANDFIVWANMSFRYMNPMCIKGFMTCCLNRTRLNYEVKNAMKEMFSVMPFFQPGNDAQVVPPYNYSRHHEGGKPYGRPWMGKQGEVTPTQCCAAGKSAQVELRNVLNCERSYDGWVELKANVSDKCSSKYVICCMKAEKRHGPRGRFGLNVMPESEEYIEVHSDEAPEPFIPDETGQQKEETMYEEPLALSYVDAADDESVEIDAGRGRKHHGGRRRGDKNRESSEQKTKKEKRPKRLPEGMRQHSNGAYYWVDSMSPEQMERMKNPKKIYFKNRKQE